MKKTARFFYESAIEILHSKRHYRYNLYVWSSMFPFIVAILWSIYDIVAGVEYRLEDDFIFLGFIIASYFTFIFGIKLGKRLKALEIKDEIARVEKEIDILMAIKKQEESIEIK